MVFLPISIFDSMIKVPFTAPQFDLLMNVTPPNLPQFSKKASRCKVVLLVKYLTVLLLVYVKFDILNHVRNR
jgi:hypothetical protein